MQRKFLQIEKDTQQFEIHYQIQTSSLTKILSQQIVRFLFFDLTLSAWVRLRKPLKKTKKCIF